MTRNTKKSDKAAGAEVPTAPSRFICPNSICSTKSSRLPLTAPTPGVGISHSIALAEIAVKMEMDALAMLDRSVSAGLNDVMQRISTVKR